MGIGWLVLYVTRIVMNWYKLSLVVEWFTLVPLLYRMLFVVGSSCWIRWGKKVCEELDGQLFNALGLPYGQHKVWFYQLMRVG